MKFSPLQEVWLEKLYLKMTFPAKHQSYNKNKLSIDGILTYVVLTFKEQK